MDERERLDVEERTVRLLLEIELRTVAIKRKYKLFWLGQAQEYLSAEEMEERRRYWGAVFDEEAAQAQAKCQARLRQIAAARARFRDEGGGVGGGGHD